MIFERIELLTGSNAFLTTYVLENEEYARKGTKKPAVIVCPGGGYTAVSQNEGEPVALAFAHMGYNSFVLNYSVKIENPFPKALLELARAVNLVRERAEEWEIDANRIIVCGFSAGGHLAGSLGMFYAEKFVADAISVTSEAIRPNALILGYPALSLRSNGADRELPAELIEKIEKGLMMDFRGPNIKQIITGKLDYTAEDIERVNLLNFITNKLPPVFMFGSMTDPIIPVTDLTQMAELCKENDVPCELHLFGNGPHGQGLYLPSCTEAALLKNQHMDKWFELALLWLSETL